MMFIKITAHWNTTERIASKVEWSTVVSSLPRSLLAFPEKGSQWAPRVNAAHGSRPNTVASLVKLQWVLPHHQHTFSRRYLQEGDLLFPISLQWFWTLFLDIVINTPLQNTPYKDSGYKREEISGCSHRLTANSLCKKLIDTSTLQHVIGSWASCKTHTRICACLRSDFGTQHINSRLKRLPHSMPFRCQMFSAKLTKVQFCTSLLTVLPNSHISALQLHTCFGESGLVQLGESEKHTLRHISFTGGQRNNC